MADDWKDGRLKDLAEVVMGTSPPGDVVNDVGEGLPLLNGPTEFTAHSPIAVQFTTEPVKVCQSGDILFCVRGSTTGRMNWADREYAIGRGLAAIRHHEGAIYQPYIRGVIEYTLPHLLALSTGSTFPSVSRPDIENIHIRIPPPNVQRAIAVVLGALDDKIEVNRKQARVLEGIARAIFKSWFVDFDPVRRAAAGEPTGLPPDLAVLFPRRLTDSSIGQVPEGWRVGTLGQVCEKPQYGLTASAADEAVGPKFLRITDINKEPWINWTTVPFCAIPEGEDAAKYRMRIGDLVIARMADPGHAALIEEDRDAVFASYLIRFRPRAAETARYLQYWTRSAAYWDLVHGRKTGSTRATLNATEIGELPLLVPPATVLARFAQFVDSLRARGVHAMAQSATLAALRDTLLPKLISGQLCIADAERIVGRADV